MKLNTFGQNFWILYEREQKKIFQNNERMEKSSQELPDDLDQLS